MMSSFIEFHIASDIADKIDGVGKCTHSATKHNPFFLCSMVHSDLLQFAKEKAEKLDLISVSIIRSEIEDFELVAGKIETLKTVANINHYDKNKFLYSFAKAKRLGYSLLLKKNAPYQTILEKIASVFGISIIVI